MSSEEITLWEGNCVYRAELSYGQKCQREHGTGIEVTVATPHVLLRPHVSALVLLRTHHEPTLAWPGKATPLSVCNSITFSKDQAWVQTVLLPYHRVCC